MILAETKYKIYSNKFLAIIKAFKIWKDYCKTYKYKIFIFTDYSNFWQFINKKSLSFK